MLWAIDAALSCSIEQFVGLSPHEVLYEFDGPRIFTTMSGSLMHLWYECGEDPETDRIRYLVVPANQQQVVQLKSGEMTVYDALRQPWLWALDVRNGQVERGWTLNDLDSVPSGAKPRPSVLLWPQLEPLASARHVEVEERVSFGCDGALRGILEWRDDSGNEGAEGRTWGNLQLWVHDTLVWGQLDNFGKTAGVAGNWINLLEFLGTAWPYLIEEEGYPISFDQSELPTRLNDLRGRAKLRWHGQQEESATQEKTRFQDFLDVHDFAEKFCGTRLPNLLLLRRGSQMVAATTKQEWTLSFFETMSTLQKLGSAISDRLAGLTDHRSKNACIRWEERDSMPSIQRLEIATGRNESSIQKIWPVGIDANVANDELYELKAAARMVGPKFPDAQLKAILEKISNLPKGKRLALSEVQKKAVEAISEHESPNVQGYLLASMLREYLGSLTGRVEPQDVLRAWGVSVVEFEIKDSPLDAIAIWGAQHAPTILLNPKGPRAHFETGKRSTLAHEICHLLVDTEGALPAVEVLGGHVSREIERRANAFAAEFLLPRAEAGAAVQRDLRYVNTQKERGKMMTNTITMLVEQYGASHETTAWQIINSRSIDETDMLMEQLRRQCKSIYAPFDTHAW